MFSMVPVEKQHRTNGVFWAQQGPEENMRLRFYEVLSKQTHLRFNQATSFVFYWVNNEGVTQDGRYHQVSLKIYIEELDTRITRLQ